jgi:hypothetical protein
MKSIALVHSGLISVLLEPKGATQEARFSSYCRLLPPRQIAKLLEGNGVTGAGDGNRTNPIGQNKGVTARFSVQLESNGVKHLKPERRLIEIVE